MQPATPRPAARVSAYPRGSGPSPPQTGPEPATPASVPAAAARGRRESADELEALAQRLIDPLSRLLRAELRADRERVGLLRDLT
jgi:hypothetical protein